MVVEAPFSPVSDESHAENLELVRDADLVMLAAVPISHGNVRNVEAVRDALAAGTPRLGRRGRARRRPHRRGGRPARPGAEFYADDAAMLAALRAQAACAAGRT